MGVLSLDSLRKKYRRYLIFFLVLDLIILAIVSIFWMREHVPQRIYLFQNMEAKFDFSLPIEANIKNEKIEVDSNCSQKVKENIVFSFQEPFSLCSRNKGSYDIGLKLFGLIPIRQIKVDVIDKKELIPSGKVIGIELNTEGVLVLGTGKVTRKNGEKVEPARNIVCTGDYIKAVNHKKIQNKKELLEELKKIDTSSTQLELERRGEEIEVNIHAVETVDGSYKLGIWVRDDTQGIGTMTYLTETGEFGALGHGINDVDTGVLMEVGTGSIYEAGIYKIEKGKKGNPGELEGYIKKNDEHRLGTIFTNTSHGIKGKYNRKDYQTIGKMQIGLKQEVKKGKATILCQIGEKVEEYNIEIKKVHLNSITKSKGMVIEITDPQLLSKTNGIVQGMSGSPILQNKKIIGAVTHVFVDNPTRGYGIFIEEMLE